MFPFPHFLKVTGKYMYLSLITEKGLIGEVIIESSPGKGCKLEIRIPIDYFASWQQQKRQLFIQPNKN
jgi:hypothetical protein